MTTETLMPSLTGLWGAGVLVAEIRFSTTVPTGTSSRVLTFRFWIPNTGFVPLTTLMVRVAVSVLGVG